MALLRVLVFVLCAQYATAQDDTPSPGQGEVRMLIEEAIALGVPYIWMQLKVINEEYAAKAEAAGAIVVMDRCPAIELPRLQNAA